jgi:hypothetical protein
MVVPKIASASRDDGSARRAAIAQDVVSNAWL